MTSRDHLQAFLTREVGASILFPRDFREQAARYDVVHQAQQRSLSTGAREIIEKLHPHPTPAQQHNLATLREGNFVTVMTGQQLGLAGGPYLAVLKALSAVKTATELERETGTRCIPIFWIQSEDHDYEEIASVTFLHDGQEQVSLPISPKELGDSVGSLLISDATVETLKTSLQDSSLDDEVKERILSAYQSGQRLPAAFQGCMQEILGETGILFFDPLHPELAEVRTSFFQQVLQEHEQTYQALLEREEALRAEGFESQVKLRSESPLFFMSWEGKRTRLTSKNDGSGEFLHGHDSFTAEELHKEMEQNPSRFTSSALLRPLFQDTLFPTAATIAGPAEFRYLSQIEPLYPLFKLAQPLIIPRVHCTIIPEMLNTRLSELNVAVHELADSVAPLVLRCSVDRADQPEALFTHAEAELGRVYSKLSQRILSVEGGLKKSVDLTWNSIVTNLSKFKGKYERVLLQKHEPLHKELLRTQSYLFPQGAPQERSVHLWSWGLKTAPSLTQLILNDIEPFENGAARVYIVDTNTSTVRSGCS